MSEFKYIPKDIPKGTLTYAEIEMVHQLRRIADQLEIRNNTME